MTVLNGDLNDNLTQLAAARLVEISGLGVLEIEDMVDEMRRRTRRGLPSSEAIVGDQARAALVEACTAYSSLNGSIVRRIGFSNLCLAELPLPIAAWAALDENREPRLQ